MSGTELIDGSEAPTRLDPPFEGATTEVTPVASAAPTVLLNDPLAGTDYQAHTLIAEGAMGTVYGAVHRRLGSWSALKVFKRTTVEALDRARIEAQIGARVTHPNLVTVTDIGITVTHHPFIAMELLDGLTLQQQLADADGGPLPLVQALDIACQLLAALQVIHEAGLVHRDLQPSNVFLCTNGTIKLLDFGIAKIVEHVSGLTPDSMMVPTAEGLFLGTPRYTAPEQASLQPLDARADLYALGCIVYRMLCGRGPFDHARTWHEIQEAHRHEVAAAPSSHLEAGIPAALDRIILQCLAKSPSERPASAEALAAELRRIELEVRNTATYGDSYVTQPHAPPTALLESARLWQPVSMPSVPLPGITIQRLLIIVALCLSVGMLLGGGIAMALGWIGYP